jgi:DNA-binding NarL/FixJ family response regulator
MSLNTHSAGAKCRLLVVDDHHLFREGVLALLSRYTDELEIIGEAGSGAQARQMILDHQPEVTLMDLRLPDESGVSVIMAMKRLLPAAEFIILTTYDGDEDIHRAMEAGAQAYLLKDMSSADLISTIRMVRQGARYIAPQAAAQLAKRNCRPCLNEREMEILQLLTRGKSNKEISSHIPLAEDTVKWHLKNIFIKLGVADRTQAAVVAVQRGMVHLG